MPTILTEMEDNGGVGVEEKRLTQLFPQENEKRKAKYLKMLTILFRLKANSFYKEVLFDWHCFSFWLVYVDSVLLAC